MTMPVLYFCCVGRHRIWCVLDSLTRCKIRPICDAHDRVITGETR